MPTVYVDPELDDYSDEEIRDEYHSRFGNDGSNPDLHKLVQFIRCGELRIVGKGSDELTDFLFDRSNKIV